ncbi:MAG: prepilin-type N-terminal cleavage/methylation domain-containing protein [Actinobacteria bacterium]|nr:prepilin-type N-terminal cleavage/methylation domain-containing protein [Actinomycetota bacterium]
MEQLRGRLPRNNQQGFTLIELLVVVSILGILAAVVTTSLVGIRALAQQRAQAAELSTVQAAFDTDVQQNNDGDVAGACSALGGSATTGGSNNFSNFPTTVSLYPTYVHSQTSQWTYYCADPASGKLGSR